MTQKTLPNDTVLFTYDKADNLTKVEDGDSLVSFAYDLAGRLVQTSVSPKGPADTAQPAVTLSYTYDLNHNRISMTSPLGATSYTYDANGQLTQITDPQGRVYAFEYDALGRRTKLLYPNGMQTRYEYDGASRLTKIETRRADGTVIASFSYTYDAAGNRTSMVELSGTHTYSYDTLDRLTHATHPQAFNPPESFSYDAVGNRTSSHLSGNYTYNAGNELVEDQEFSYQYDANGNLSQKTEKATGAVTTYTYNAEDQLVKVTLPDGTVAEYGYDGTGRRIYKKVGGRVTKYVYDQEDILLQYDSGNNLTASWVHGPGIDEPLAVTVSNKTYFYVYDGLGSVVALVDEQGNIVNRYVYDSFGNIVSRQETIEQPYTYTAREEDKETGLYYYRARYYDARVGRFVQTDKMNLKDRLEFSWKTSLTNSKVGGNRQVNGFQYCLNNPMVCTDPNGQLTLQVTIGTIIIVVTVKKVVGLCISYYKCITAWLAISRKARQIHQKYPYTPSQAFIELQKTAEWKKFVIACPSFAVKSYTL